MSNPQKLEQSGVMDLHRACRIGDLQSIQAAFRADPSKIDGKDIGVKSIQLGWAPLYRTVICGHLQAAHFLLQNGADPDIPNNLGQTPLHQAADNSQYKIAALLLDFKANPNSQQNDGDTPLHHAAFRGDWKMIELLLEYGGDCNLPNNILKRTPLHYAVDCGQIESVKIMLKGNADPSVQDQQGKSALALTRDIQLLNIMSKEVNREFIV